jgi:simple sugar transport system ATP-binding protein
MDQICKSFAGNSANANICLNIYPGEIHVILGENGAGKSTLMNILTGLYKADSGDIYIDGVKTHLASPKDAIRSGIGMIHQHFRLVPSLSVTENVILGHHSIPILLSMQQFEQSVQDSAHSFNISIDPTALISQLSVGEQQRVEILKALYRGSRVLILDEPTAVLTPQEASALFITLRAMARSGKAVIVITHKLREVMEIADRITVLRGGEKVAEMMRQEVNEKLLATLMVGKEMLDECDKVPLLPSSEVLRLENVHALNGKGILGIKNVSFTISENEILGIAGVAGNGQKELCEIIAGLRQMTQGSLSIRSKGIANPTPKTMIRAGVAYIPDDRLGTGLVPGLNIVDNMILKNKYDQKKATSNIIDYKQAMEYTQNILSKYSVKVNDLRAPVKLLSGGNLQRLLFAREISWNPDLIVASYPVRGLDIEATETVHELLLAQRKRGAAILLISEDLDEIFKLSDRIAVLFEGELMGIVNTCDSSFEEIGLMMLGSKKAEEIVA